jgi:hypothetical protein
MFMLHPTHVSCTHRCDVCDPCSVNSDHTHPPFALRYPPHTVARQAFVCMASQLPSHLLDDLILQRLGDLVEQLVYAFPTLVSGNFGAR